MTKYRAMLFFIQHGALTIVMLARSLFSLPKTIARMLVSSRVDTRPSTSTRIPADEPRVWRREPEIPEDRQAFLLDRSQHPHTNGPFFGIALSRADVEWLLATVPGTHIPLDLRGAHLQGIPLDHLDLSHVRFDQAHLVRVNMTGTCLVGASFRNADLTEACLQQANMREAVLAGAILYETLLDADTHLERAVLSDSQRGCACVENARWEGTNLTVLDWTQLPVLGDERKAHTRKTFLGYRAAVRANRQFATVLREQGLSEEADSFAYRGQRLKRDVLMMNVLRAVIQLPEYRWTIRPVFFLHRIRRYQLLIALLLGLILSLFFPHVLDIRNRIELYWSLMGCVTLLLGAVFVLLCPLLQLLAVFLLPLYIGLLFLAFAWVLNIEFSSPGTAASSPIFLDSILTVTPFAVLLTVLFAVLARRPALSPTSSIFWAGGAISSTR